MTGFQQKPSVRIYVQSKLDLDDVTPAYLLPSSFLDIPTDIIAVGRLGLAKLVPKPLEADRTARGQFRNHQTWLSDPAGFQTRPI